MVIVKIITLAVTFIVGSFAVFSLQPSMARRRFFAFFPPSRFLANAIMGFDKLQALDEEVFNERGIKIEEQKQGLVEKGDKGFNELIKVLKGNASIKGEIQEIILVEDTASVIISDSSPRVRLLYYLVKGGVREHLLYDPFDPDKPMRELRNWIEDSFRKQLAYWTMGLLVVWVLANSYMLY